MSEHLVVELKTSINQIFQVKREISVKQISLKLYKHNSPLGNFTVNLKEGTNIIATKVLTSAIMESGMTDQGITPLDYTWGYFLSDFSSYFKLRKNIDYTIELVGSSYTFSESAWLGWIKEHEHETNKIDETIIDEQKSLSFRLWGME